jgi:2',3'-cyclic-nucleotide 2'-phosphodiesterase (5'-nucleotidase family)
VRAPLRIPALLLAPALALASCAAGPREDTLVLFHTNDLHGHVERAPTLSGLVKAEREKRPDVLWLDAGDAISGTPVSTVFRGTPVFTVLGLAGVDAACLGNHEFDHGAARIAKYREAAPYPILCANARAPDGALLADAEWAVFPVDGLRVGIVGLVTEMTPSLTVKAGNEGVRFEPARAALERIVPVLRERCDLLVALTHLGYDEDVAIARSVPGIDVLVGGHSHTDLPGPVQVGSTIVVQAFCYGKRLGRLDLTVDLEKRRVSKWEGRNLPVEPASQPRDAATARLVAELEREVSKTVDVVVGNADRDLDRPALRDLAERVFREALKADFGLQNEGGVRDAIPKGPVSVRALWQVFPFDNNLVLVRVKGAALPERLRKGTDPGRTYAVATNTFVADHLETYLPGAEPGVEDSGIPVRDAVVDWVRKHPDLR